jgi:hypothetical protein
MRHDVIAVIVSGLLLAGCTSAPTQSGGNNTSDVDQPTAEKPTGFSFSDDFETLAVGASPAGAAFSRGNWTVEANSTAPAGSKVLTVAGNVQGDFPVLIYDKGSFADVDARVKACTQGGAYAQAPGIVFRFSDANNYYIMRANALEGNMALFIVKEGTRTKLVEKDANTTLHTWHSIRLEADDDHIMGYYDGEKLIDTTEATFKVGKVGLWVKDDTSAQFDDFRVTPG